MDALGATGTINSWRHLLIDGEPESIDRMWEEIARSLEQRGWARDLTAEASSDRAAGRAGRSLDFVGGPERGPKLRLGLARVSDRRVRGWTSSLIDGPADMTPIDVARVVEDVIEGVVKPAASALGLRVATPRFDASHVPPRTMASLRAFGDSAAGVWPLVAIREDLWRRFVIHACREGASFDVDELTAWFVADGLDPKRARALTDRFLGEASLISEYADGIGA